MRVPYSTVGLIVGPKGATIKHIQRTTKTTIKSPDRGAESIFEIIGTAANVERARQEINAFVVWRGIDDDGDEISNEFSQFNQHSIEGKKGLNKFLVRIKF